VRRSVLPFLAGVSLLFGCSGGSDPGAKADGAGGSSSATGGGDFGTFDVPLAKLPDALRAEFNDGDLAFSTPLREGDGLGPLYTRSSCDSCHSNAVRGPGLVQKMSVVEADRVTAAADQSALPFGHTVHPLLTGAGHTPIVPPEGDTNILVTSRVGPPVLGRGYMEAVDDAEIERVASEQSNRTDGIHGRVNHVPYGSETHSADLDFGTHQKGDIVIGRFGLKARVPTLDDFTADAFQGDMGITSPLRPNEFPNPDGLTDDAKPGVDVGLASVTSRAMYVRLLAIPERRSNPAGAAAFDTALCSACHVPTLKTRANYPVPSLAGIDAPIYTDLLLHRMTAALADGLPANSVDGEAGSLDWRTAPLMGLRFNRTYLHDGRARTVEEAILAHRGEGSEANASIDRFDALSATDRQNILDFVNAL
jgi:CxxC motif-containing protein (DUF1111 family)